MQLNVMNDDNTMMFESLVAMETKQAFVRSIKKVYEQTHKDH